MADADLESNSSSGLFNNLCDESLGEVLVRLSSKAAVRFQVVCKRWYSLISSPYFIDRFNHLRHDVQSSSLVIQNSYYFWEEFHSDIQIISDDDYSSSHKAYVESASFVPCCSPTDRHTLQLEASYADLILCSYITHSPDHILNYCVSNLQTRKWVALPPLPADMGFRNGIAVGFLCFPPPCSQCKPAAVATSHHKFMVVRLCVSEPVSGFKVQVFSSEDSVWKSLVVSSPSDFKFDRALTSLVACRGMLHWLNTDCILVYDPLNTPQTFSRIIHLPIQSPLYDHNNNNCKSWCFEVCQGRLRLVLDSVEEDDVVDVWELGNYDSGLWNSVHKVYLRNVAYNISLTIAPEVEGSFESTLCSFSILSLHPQKGDIVYLRVNNGVVTFNMKTRMVEQFYQRNTISVMGCAKAVSLADQWWPTPLSCTN